MGVNDEEVKIRKEEIETNTGKSLEQTGNLQNSM
jgi:hypothetical protein